MSSVSSLRSASHLSAREPTWSQIPPKIHMNRLLPQSRTQRSDPPLLMRRFLLSGLCLTIFLPSRMSKAPNFPILHHLVFSNRWEARSKAKQERLLSFEADILCLQELDEFESFYRRQLDGHGYASIYVKRPGKKEDGCGIFYRHARVSLVENEVIQYNDLVPDADDPNGEPNTSSDEEASGNDTDGGNPNDPKFRLKRDCVGIMAAFRASHALENTFVVANTHIYWDPDWMDVKLAQAKHLVGSVSKFQSLLATKLGAEIPGVVCGDFNSTPGDQVYSYLTSGGSADRSLLDAPVIVSADQPRDTYLPLHSLYASIKEEPDLTNCTRDFTGTLDYIFFSSFDSLKPVSLLEVPTAESEDLKGWLPNYNHPSDHLPIGADCMVCSQKQL